MKRRSSRNVSILYGTDQRVAKGRQVSMTWMPIATATSLEQSLTHFVRATGPRAHAVSNMLAAISMVHADRAVSIRVSFNAVTIEDIRAGHLICVKAGEANIVRAPHHTCAVAAKANIAKVPRHTCADAGWANTGKVPRQTCAAAGWANTGKVPRQTCADAGWADIVKVPRHICVTARDIVARVEAVMTTLEDRHRVPILIS
jgi:hypothetical protein